MIVQTGDSIDWWLPLSVCSSKLAVIWFLHRSSQQIWCHKNNISSRTGMQYSQCWWATNYCLNESLFYWIQHYCSSSKQAVIWTNLYSSQTSLTAPIAQINCTTNWTQVACWEYWLLQLFDCLKFEPQCPFQLPRARTPMMSMPASACIPCQLPRARNPMMSMPSSACIPCSIPMRLISVSACIHVDFPWVPTQWDPCLLQLVPFINSLELTKAGCDLSTIYISQSLWRTPNNGSNLDEHYYCR